MVSEVTRPCSIVTFKYSSWPLPALRSVSTAFWIGSFVRSASINAVEALSTLFTILRSLMVAFPVASAAAKAGFCLHAPRPAQDVDLAFVLIVLRFPFDQAVLGALDHQEHVAGAADSHSTSRSSTFCMPSVRSDTVVDAGHGVCDTVTASLPCCP